MLRKIASIVTILALPLTAMATEYRTVERPRQECWNEQVQVQAAAPGYGGALIGGIAGGLLGNQVGGGNGKTAATALGAMTGAVVGDRMSVRGPATSSYQTVQRCRTVVDHIRVPVVYEPAPVTVVAPVYYVEQPQQWRRKHWKRDHDEDDDDDDDDDYRHRGHHRGHHDD